MNRPTFHEVYMQVAYAISQRATCPDRKVGCVLIDKDFRVLSTGYNGVPSGVKHCTLENPCPGRSGDHCHAIHAEQNALLQCPDTRLVSIAYVTTSPCLTCAKLLSNTNCRVIIYDEAKHYNNEIKDFWESSGKSRALLHIEEALESKATIKLLTQLMK